MVRDTDVSTRMLMWRFGFYPTLSQKARKDGGTQVCTQGLSIAQCEEKQVLRVAQDDR